MSTEKASPIDWALFKETFDAARTVALTGHIRPDGDSIGSVVALGRALKSLGKKVALVNGHSVPPNLAFLDPANEIRKFALLTDEERAFIDSADLRVALDASSWAQLGDSGEMFKTPGSVKVVLDHHAKGDPIGDRRFVDPDVESTGSLVFQAVKTLGVPLTPEIALPIFVATATDSGWFRFASTKASTFRRVAELIDAGVEVDWVYKILYEQETFGRLKLVGAALTRCERFLDGKGIVMSLRRKDFDDAGALPSDSEDIVNVALQVAGVEVAEIAIEQKDGSVKSSFRSRCALDCSLLAAAFGGGGHKAAAGATFDRGLDDALAQMIAKTEEMYAALS